MAYNPYYNPSFDQNYDPFIDPPAPPPRPSTTPVNYTEADPNLVAQGADPNLQRAGSDPQQLANLQIQQWYQQYLGRPASQPEVQQWVSKMLTLPQLQKQIQALPEAATYGKGQIGGGGTGGAQPQITNPTDQAQIRAWLQWRASQPGHDPYLDSPEGLTYYTNAILKEGGLNDPSYWTNKSTLAAYGGAVGAPGASGAGAAGAGMSVDPSYLKPFTGTFGDAYKELYGKAWDPSQTPGEFQPPDPAKIAQDPGYQFRKEQAVGGLQNTAAARGLLNSGGTLANILGLEDSMAGQEYDNAWNRGFAGWQGNWNNYNNQFGKAWQQFVEDKDSFYKNESNPFSKLYQAASLGASAASA